MNIQSYNMIIILLIKDRLQTQSEHIVSDYTDYYIENFSYTGMCVCVCV